MLFVENSSLDPYFNIAAEEYLLKHFNADITMIWRSNPSVIVGKHQNTLAEINIPFVMSNNIPVIRRLSGGGTVVHDPGNVNFTFIKNAEQDRLVDFKGFTRPVIDYLATLGIEAHFQGKNDLRVNGLKISGNAEHVHKRRVLHHGTLLFNSDLSRLNEAIRAREDKFNSKAVKSVRSRVTNISDMLRNNMTSLEFMEDLTGFLRNRADEKESYIFDVRDQIQINKLKMEKYTQWEWNYGYSPTYSFSNSTTIDGHDVKVDMTVAKGIITKVDILVNNAEYPHSKEFAIMQGTAHHPDRLREILRTMNFLNFTSSTDTSQILSLFF